jgi:hypothetical protein
MERVWRFNRPEAKNLELFNRKMAVVLGKN